MSAIRLDPQMPYHPKILEAGPAAAWMWVCACCWSSANDAASLIPKDVIPELTGFRHPAEIAARLVEVGLFVDAGEHFGILVTH